MSKFTEGPWQVEDRTIYALQHHGWRKGVEQFENRFSASVQGAKCPDDELLANAVLMAAAPELLALLIDSQDSIGGDWRQRRDAIVAKATGAA